MADEADLGNASAELHLRLALARVRKSGGDKPRPYSGNGACEDCGEEIPKERREAAPGCTRCVDCQIRAERR